MEKTGSTNGRLCRIRFKLQPLDPSSSSGGGRGDENGCVLCGRKFPSIKSLCGHMKSHPGRGWQGIQPPDEEVKTERIVHGWPVTGKRGRKTDDSVASDLDSTSVKIGRSTEEGKQGESEIPPEKILLDDPRGGEEPRDKNSDVGREDKKGKRLMKRESSELDGTGQGRRAKKTRGETSGHATAAAPANYTCNRCQKSFRSHQALGGHMSSCSKPKKKATSFQAPNANMAVVFSRDPNLDLSLSLSLSLPPYTPGSSTSVAVSDNTIDSPSTEESANDEPKMIKFL